MNTSKFNPKWVWSDAVNMALDLYNQGKIKLSEMDAVASSIWRDMEAENDKEAL